MATKQKGTFITRAVTLNQRKEVNPTLVSLGTTFKNQALSTLMIGLGISFFIYFVGSYFVPFLAKKEIIFDIRDVINTSLFGIVLGIYLNFIMTVSKDELSRYFLTLVLGFFGMILPILNIWQLRYLFDQETYPPTYQDFNKPPYSSIGDVVGPLYRSDLVPWHYSYTEAVAGYPPFINTGAALISISGLLVFLISLRFLIYDLRGTLAQRDHKGLLLKSQFDILINLGSREYVFSMNKWMRKSAGFMLLGLLFVLLGVDGLHGMQNLLIKPGIYLTLFVALHIIYLSANPHLRNKMSESKVAYSFLLPAVLMLIFELYVPIILAFFLSFQNIRNFPFTYYDGTKEGKNLGFENYELLVNIDLVYIVIIFVISSYILAKLSGQINKINNKIQRRAGKLLAFAIWLSILNWSIVGVLAPRYDNFIATESSIFVSPSPAIVFANTIKWTILSVTAHIIIGTSLAMLMNTKFKGRSVIRSLMIIPWAVPNFITISIFAAFILDNESGAFNIFLRLLHLEPFNFMKSENILMSAIWVNIWLGYPFIMVAVLAALQSIPQELYEAADIDGATRWQKFRYITFPMIKPTLYVITLLGFLWTFNLFNVIYLMVLDKQSVLDTRDYYILIVYIFFVFRGGNWAIAATMSFLLFLIVAGFSYAFTKATGKGPYELGSS